MSKHSNWEQYPKGSTSTPYSYTGAYTAKTCQHPPKPVQVGDVQLYGCAERDVDLAVKEGFDVISPLVTSSTTALNSYYGLILWFPIQDYGAPETKRLRIHAERLIQFARAGNKVVTYCQGSHGRTGTVLATCIGVLEPDVDPIDAVRERHCSHAVEAQVQVEAIFKALNRPLPAKWQPDAAISQSQPEWVKQGLLWEPSVTDVSKDVVIPSLDPNDPMANKCDLCAEWGTASGIDKLHWFGHIKAHLDCYEKAAKQILEKEAKAKQGHSSTTPSADSPPAKVVTEKNLATSDPMCHFGNCVYRKSWHIGLNRGHNFMSAEEYYANKDKERALKAAQDAGLTNPVEATGETPERPFFNQWSTKQQRKFRPVENQRDQFGDIVCFKCHYLIIDPYSAMRVDKRAFHKDCEDAKRYVECTPLCLLCSVMYVDEPEKTDYCFECAQEVEEAVEKENDTVVGEDNPLLPKD